MIDTKAMEAGRYPIDEFRDPASRTEAYPTLAAYLQSRTDDELCAMVWNDAYRHNIFGTYSGYSIDLAREVGAEFARRATPSRNDILEEAATALRVVSDLNALGHVVTIDTWGLFRINDGSELTVNQFLQVGREMAPPNNPRSWEMEE